MDTIIVLTFIGVFILIVLESFKLMSAFSERKAHQEEGEAMEVLMQAIEEGRVESTSTNIKIDRSEDKGVDAPVKNQKRKG